MVSRFYWGAEATATSSLAPKFHLEAPPVTREISFRANRSRDSMPGSARQWPQQGRSQVQIGNEGKASSHGLRWLPLGPREWLERRTPNLTATRLYLILTLTYRERWRGWPSETAATGWGFFFGKVLIVQVPNPARCGPPNAVRVGKDKEREPCRIPGACFSFSPNLVEVDPR